MIKYICILCLLFFSCQRKNTIFNIDNTTIGDIDSIGIIEERELILAREYVGDYDLYNISKIIRLSPFFIVAYKEIPPKYDTIYTTLSAISSKKYKQVINVISKEFAGVDTLNMDVFFQTENVLDSCNNIGGNLFVYKTSSLFKKRVRQYNCRANLKNHQFNGNVYYQLFKIKYYCMYVGTSKIIIPNFNIRKNENRSKLNSSHIAHKYIILKIISIEPYSSNK